MRPFLPPERLSMISHLFLATSLAASLALIADGVHAQNVPATFPTIPPLNCAKPELPGKLASNSRISAFNKEYAGYSACIKKYVEETKTIVNAAVAAGNAAVEEFNKFAVDINAQNEAAKN
jgi:hypothetical protein